MHTDRQPDTSWLEALAERDSQVHKELAGDALVAEVTSLRERNAMLVAALTKAREEVAMRDVLIQELRAYAIDKDEYAETVVHRASNAHRRRRLERRPLRSRLRATFPVRVAVVAIRDPQRAIRAVRSRLGKRS